MNSNNVTNKVLILFAHPALQNSRVNRHLIRYVQDIDGVTFHDLYETYPDFHIDIKHEQKLLERNDIIVFQHPFFWFNMPALLKEWKDLVLEHGWAYGSEGTALKGKKLLNAITTGGRESAYQKEGYNRITVRELLAPIEKTAHMCGMDYLPPIVVHGTHQIKEPEIKGHGEDYRKIITALRDGRVNLDEAKKFPRLNAEFDALLIK